MDSIHPVPLSINFLKYSLVHLSEYLLQSAEL